MCLFSSNHSDYGFDISLLLMSLNCDPRLNGISRIRGISVSEPQNPSSNVVLEIEIRNQDSDFQSNRNVNIFNSQIRQQVNVAIPQVNVPTQQINQQVNVPTQQTNQQVNVPIPQVNVPTQQTNQQVNVPIPQVNVPTQQTNQQVNVLIPQVNVPTQQINQQVNVPIPQTSQQANPTSREEFAVNFFTVNRFLFDLLLSENLKSLSQVCNSLKISNNSLRSKLLQWQMPFRFDILCNLARSIEHTVRSRNPPLCYIIFNFFWSKGS